MEPTKVILVDDDTHLGNLISMELTADGYKVHYQNSLTGIKGIIESFEPSILVLDVEIGEDDGITTATDILETYPLMPILFISSHIDIDDIKRGVSGGGVGYIRKPFDMDELKVYIERFALTEKSLFTEIGSYSLNLETRELLHKGVRITQLSLLEFNGLQLLLKNKNKTVDYKDISIKLWDKEYPETEASMNNLISKLRKLLKNDPRIFIQTIREIGYKLILKQ
ncbi:MAG TPA: response regulator transcription factor [Dysgonamonadaceae bacterium]|nr:response regulator transcription factor [Dysgonamonadaceae bacterium]